MFLQTCEHCGKSSHYYISETDCPGASEYVCHHCGKEFMVVYGCGKEEECR